MHFHEWKVLFFGFKVRWRLFLKFQLTISQHGSGNGLAPYRRQAIIWTSADPVHWRIYAALGGDELIVSFIVNLSIWQVDHSKSRQNYLTSGTDILFPGIWKRGFRDGRVPIKCVSPTYPQAHNIKTFHSTSLCVTLKKVLFQFLNSCIEDQSDTWKASGRSVKAQQIFYLRFLINWMEPALSQSKAQRMHFCYTCTGIFIWIPRTGPEPIHRLLYRFVSGLVMARSGEVDVQDV